MKDLGREFPYVQVWIILGEDKGAPQEMVEVNLKRAYGFDFARQSHVANIARTPREMRIGRDLRTS